MGSDGLYNRAQDAIDKEMHVWGQSGNDFI